LPQSDQFSLSLILITLPKNKPATRLKQHERTPTSQPFTRCLLLIATVLIVFSCQNNSSTESKTSKFRTVILTDMTHDNGNSLIRYLYYYASLFDLEGLIITNQLPDFNHDDAGPWEKGMGILSAYKEELPQLRLHDPELPDYEELLAVTKKGRGKS